MKTKEKRNNVKSRLLKIIGFSLLIFSVSILSHKFITDYLRNAKENESIDYFFETIKDDNISDSVSNSEQLESKKPATVYNYIAVLEIPKISLKKGLFDIDDSNNNVNRNIEILKNSVMPDVSGGLLVLAGHSGRSAVSYFNNLNKLSEKDLIHIYYKNIKYSYEITKINRQDKVGAITVTRTDVNELILTTCDQQTKGKQIIVISKLINSIPY